jgi:translation initiation factor 4E
VSRTTAAKLEERVLTSVCRETVKRVLNLPADTAIIWKSHDDSISQRNAIDQAREKPRRVTLTSDDGVGTKEKSGAS